MDWIDRNLGNVALIVVLLAGALGFFAGALWSYKSQRDEIVSAIEREMESRHVD